MKARSYSDITHTLSDIYNNSGSKTPFVRWKYIIQKYYDIIYNDMLNGETIILPYGMGSLYLKKYKPKSLPAERNQSSLQKKFIPQLNLHTDGYQIETKWNKKNIQLKNKGLYKFRFTRTNNRLLSKKLKSGEVNIYSIQ